MWRRVEAGREEALLLGLLPARDPSARGQVSMLEAARKMSAFWNQLVCLAQLEEQMPGHIHSLGPQ